MNGDSPPTSPIAAAAAAAVDPLKPGQRGRGCAAINPGRCDLWEPTDSEQHFPSLADRARASTRHVVKNGLASPTHSAHATFFRPHAAGSGVSRVSADRRAKKVRIDVAYERFRIGVASR